MKDPKLYIQRVAERLRLQADRLDKLAIVDPHFKANLAGSLRSNAAILDEAIQSIIKEG